MKKYRVSKELKKYVRRVLIRSFYKYHFITDRDPFHALEICAFYDHPIGDGVVKGTDWNHLFALSGICIVLQLSDRKDHFFEITTAYPIPDFDEVDEILDAMDEYQITRIK